MSTRPRDTCDDCSAITAAAYLHVASLAIAAYDWIWTLPVEFQIYSDQRSFFSMGRGCILFIAIRYISIAGLVANNIEFFLDTFSLSQCRLYMYLPLALKCVQMTVAHIILFVRTWAISRRSKPVFWWLTILLVICVVVELWSSFYKRVPTQYLGNCASGNDPDFRIAWIYYASSTLFNLVCVVIASVYLWMQSAGSSSLQGLSRKLMKEGIFFFVILTSVNILNWVIYIKADLTAESAATALGYAATWIMAQRILIQLRKLRPSMQTTSLGTNGIHALNFRTRKDSVTTIALSDVNLGGVCVAVHVEEHYEDHVNHEHDRGTAVAVWVEARGGRDSRETDHGDKTHALKI